MNQSKRWLLLIILVVGLALALRTGISQALNGNPELNQLENPDFDLLVNGQDDPQTLVQFSDLKPGDNLFQDKNIRVNSSVVNQARIYLHLKDLVNNQGFQTEPEDLEEVSTPKSDIENYLTYDLLIGGEVLIDYLDEVLLPQASSCWLPLGLINTNSDVTVSQSFHFDESVTNWAQGDELAFSEEFLALSTDAPLPPTPDDSGRVWDEVNKYCVNASEQITRSYLLTFSCTSGCTGSYPHTMNILSLDGLGNFTGNGNYNPNSAYTWDLTGTLVGAAVNFQIVYTGLNPGYTVNATGSLLFDGAMAGTATGPGQTFTWLAEK